MAFHDNSIPVDKQDIALAKKLLAEAGYPNGGFDLEYLYVTGDKNELGAGQVLQAALKPLGVNLKPLEVSWTILVGRMQDKPNAPDTYGYYTFPAYNDPDAVLMSMFHTSQQGTGGYNGSYSGSPETDKMLEEARTTTDNKRREELYKKIQQDVYDNADVIPVANPNSIILRRSWAKGYKYTPTWHNTINYHELSLQGKQ